MGTNIMKQFIIAISLITAIAFLVLSVVSTWEIFSTLISGDDAVRGELWLLLILCFTGGVIMLSIAWGIAELTESRRAQRQMMLDGIVPPRSQDEDDEEM